MKIPTSPLFLVVSLLIQLYLFGELRTCVRTWFADVKMQGELFLFATYFLILSLFPFAWHDSFGLYGSPSYSWFVRGLFTLSSIWWVGSAACAIALFVYSLFRRFVLFVRQRPIAEDPDLGRRHFLRKGVGAVIAPFVISGYGVLLERRRFELEHFDILITGLSSSLSQLNIVQLTDIHVGPFMPPEELAQYVEAVNQLRPDLIALTGDFVTKSHDEVLPCVETLAKLKARYGIFACLGNHDSYAGVADELTRLFGENGICTLRNDATAVQIGNSKVGVLGIDDPRRGQSDLQRALRAAQKDRGEVNILLSHRPEIFPTAAREGIDLVLSGHYHGGQVKLLPDPQGLSIARLMTPYAEGLFRLPPATRSGAKAASLFVSRGVGISGLPIRINCPPQIAHLTLRKA
jgi:uncharacterized protein